MSPVSVGFVLLVEIHSFSYVLNHVTAVLPWRRFNYLLICCLFLVNFSSFFLKIISLLFYRHS